MRFALIVVAALVSCVFLPTEPASARPRAGQVAEAKKKVKKKRPAAKPKASKKAKAAQLAKAEEAPVVRDDEEEPERKPVAAPAPRAASRAQIVDDEVPRNEPKKKR